MARVEQTKLTQEEYRMSLEAIYEAVMNGDADATHEGVSAALESSMPADKILYQACIPAMEQIGRMFEQGEAYVPEMLIAARAMQAAMDLLAPHLSSSDHEPEGKVVLGTVCGDLHDVGKNLVGLMLQSSGFEVVDLGTNVPAAKFVDAVRHHQPHVIAMSCLLTTTMPAMQATVEALAEAGLRGQVMVLIGGAPVTQGFADRIGADGFAPDASSATRKARELLANVRHNQAA
jgi:5-methyltetrahydrofolate--homocysteine methyltransferase